MAEDDPEHIALGCITKYVESPEPYREFLRNVEEHGHKVDVLILALSRTADLAVLRELNELVPIEVIEVGDYDLDDELVSYGVDADDVTTLLDTLAIEDLGFVPYCALRNAVLLKALMMKMEKLIFFDSNMRPLELVGEPTAQSGHIFREVDFVGAHLGALRTGAAVTTGGYSGYDAFPPLQCANLRDLLHGIGREDAYDVISAEGSLAGLHLASGKPQAPKPAYQAFAGNLGIDLTRALTLPPFFSRWYHLGESVVLTRGEDTLLGAAAVSAQIGCIDVGTRIFLDPHCTYPKPPELSREQIRDRLYWDCLGWIARLPLLDHVRHSAGILDWDLDELQASRRLALQQGADDLSITLSDNRFLDLPTFFDLVYMRLERTLAEYSLSKKSWIRVVRTLQPAR